MSEAVNDFILAIALVAGVTLIGACGGTIAASFKHEQVSTCGGSTAKHVDGVPKQMGDCQ